MCDAFHAAIAKYSPMGDDVNHMPEKVGPPDRRLPAVAAQCHRGTAAGAGFCLFNNGDFRTSIEDGINSGRDTDSIGVMAGAILGALHGEAVIDAEDLALLDSANRLDLTAAADAFTDTARAILDRRPAASRCSARARLRRLTLI